MGVQQIIVPSFSAFSWNDTMGNLPTLLQKIRS